jgi:hypothetical protein
MKFKPVTYKTTIQWFINFKYFEKDYLYKLFIYALLWLCYSRELEELVEGNATTTANTILLNKFC